MNGSYCRERTKRRLGQIVPAFIILFIAVACAGYSFIQWKDDAKRMEKKVRKKLK